MRSEIKIPIDEDLKIYFNNWKDFNKKIFKPYNDRQINSIYFDDDNYITAQDNLSGISNRRKYRIRWYGKEFKNFIYEIKIKKNNLGKKVSLNAKTNEQNIENLFSFKNNFLKENNNKFFLDYIDNFNLKPKLKISYLRSYFLYDGKIRVTYDQKIKYSLADKFNFRENKINDSMDVIEIKFDPKNTNFALELIKDSKFVPKRFSKYLRGLYLMGIANYL